MERLEPPARPAAEREEEPRQDLAPAAPPATERKYTLLNAVTVTPHGATWLALDEAGRRVALRELLVSAPTAEGEARALTEVRGPRASVEAPRATRAKGGRLIAALLSAVTVATVVGVGAWKVRSGEARVQAADRRARAAADEALARSIAGAEFEGELAAERKLKDQLLDRTMSLLHELEAQTGGLNAVDQRHVDELRRKVSSIRAEGSVNAAMYLLEDAAQLNAQKHPPGLLVLTSSPIGASVWVDGRDTGLRTPVPRANALRVSPGVHTVQFKLDGRESKETLVTVDQGVEQVVRHSF